MAEGAVKLWRVALQGLERLRGIDHNNTAAAQEQLKLLQQVIERCEGLPELPAETWQQLVAELQVRDGCWC